jgi:hypothetical protein
MKKVILTLALASSAIFAYGQYYIIPPSSGNPGNVNQEDTEYPLGGGLSSGWDTVLTSSQANPTWSNIQNIPFGIDFNGDVENQFIVSSSGVLTFDVTTLKSAPSHANQSLPHTSIPNSSVCVWGLSGKGSNDYIVSKTFGTAPNRQFWVTFNNYSEPATFVNHYSYFSIVIEETTNNIYIVDQRNFGASPTLTIGIQTSGFGYQLTASPNVGPLAINDPTRADNQYYTFVQGIQPQYDASAEGLLINEFLFLGSAPYDFAMILKNHGTDTIVSVDFNYTKNGLNETDSTFSNLSIAPFASDTLMMPGTWTPTATGSYLIDSWFDQINGNTDENNSNDTVSVVSNIVNQDYLRTPIIETFTSSTSPQSLYANNHIESLLSNNGNGLTSIKYPMSWPGAGDPYHTNECKLRRQEFGITSVNSVQVDGIWGDASMILTQSDIDERFAAPAFIKLSSNYWTNNQTVNIDVTIDPLENIVGTDHSLYVAIFEKTTTQNAKNSGETEFYHVMKKMVPNQNGTSVSNLTKGVSQTFNMSYTFNGSFRLPTNAGNAINHSTEHSVEDFNDLGVIAWVQNTTSLEILQSAYALSTIGQSENAGSIPISIYPNPATDEIHIVVNQDIGNATVVLTNLQGQLLKTIEHNFNQEQELNISVNDQPSGLYIIEIQSESNSGVTRFIIE